MKMKNLTTAIISFILLTATSYAQRGPLRDRFEDKKDQIKFLNIIKKIKLNSQIIIFFRLIFLKI
jgi:hypothetical protein